ncbi:MAG: alpha/beta hydrolase [Nostoc sp. ChiSLP01]|nr:alpha/beta hydrolase [Nostoc sp. CmiSLP01]MDZ8286531.1 alpha/beta hydrolase [Nostoc sp. ChiSLP01]
MIYLDELKELVLLHSQAQGISFEYSKSILEKITSEEGNQLGSWVYEWSKDAHSLQKKARWLEAAQLYNLARFPFIKSAAHIEAHQACIQSFQQWLLTKPNAQKLEIKTPQGNFKTYFTSGSEQKKRPLLVVCGGIVSIKEQWAAFIENADVLGMAIALVEMPGVGENEIIYSPTAWKMFSALLDRLSQLADVNNTYLVALSFSGHMAIQSAISDKRIRAITTASAPIHHFFTDDRWWNQVPITTKRTLAHIMNIDIADLFLVISSMALSQNQLKSLAIPLNYIVSLRDEIIPITEKEFLQKHTSKLNLKQFNDVHGSPNHIKEVKFWILLSLLKNRHSLAFKAQVFRTLLFILQTKRIFKLGGQNA